MKLEVSCTLDCSHVAVDVTADRGPSGARVLLSASEAESLADELFAAALIVRDADARLARADALCDAERDRRMMADEVAL